MTCRTKLSAILISRRLTVTCLATCAVTLTLWSPTTAYSQNRFPTFGLPSSAYGAPGVEGPAVHSQSTPRSLSPVQTDGARMLTGSPSGGGLQTVAHSETPNPPTSQPSTSVQRELQRLYEQNGREMPPMDMPQGGFRRPPVQQTSVTSPPKRSVVDLMKRQDTRFNTVQTQSSVRPAPMAPPMQSPPRTAEAVAPTDGRRTPGGVFSGLFNWGQRSPQTAAPTQPPLEPQPYRPQTYKAQPQVQRSAPQPPQQGPATVQSTPQRQAPATVQSVQRPTTPAPLKAPTPPQSPATEVVTARSFDLIPLMEPVLAPPAEDDFFPADVAETTPVPQVVPQPEVTASRTIETPAVQTQIPEVVPQPRNYANELGITPPAQQSAIEIATEVAAPQPIADAFDDEFGMDDLFPEDGDTPSERNDDGNFQLPRSAASPQVTQNAVPDAQQPVPSPYTGRKLASGAFEQPMGTPDSISAEPRKLIATAPAATSLTSEPAHFFPSDEQAIEPEEGQDLDVGDQIATPTSQPRVGVTLQGSRMQQIAAREGVGLKGYCPVALRDERTLNDGKAAYISFYNTKAYYFSTSEAKAAFDDNPKKYAPASDGSDVTLMALTGEVLEGSLDHAVWYKDRLYLFSTDENLKTFMAAPSAMALTQ